MYSFKDRLNRVPRSRYSDEFEKLYTTLGISKETLYRYMNATWENPVSIPTARLLLAATFWNCTVDDLINHPAQIEQ